MYLEDIIGCFLIGNDFVMYMWGAVLDFVLFIKTFYRINSVVKQDKPINPSLPTAQLKTIYLPILSFKLNNLLYYFYDLLDLTIFINV